MLVIRLSRQGRSKRPFYRVVLTEHTKPAQCGHLEVLWSYDPLKHIFEADIDSIKSRIEKWAKPSERVAKLLFKQTNDTMFKKFYKEVERKALPKKEKSE